MRNLVLFAALAVALAGCDQAAEESDEPAAPAAAETATAAPEATETAAEEPAG